MNNHHIYEINSIQLCFYLCIFHDMRTENHLGKSTTNNPSIPLLYNAIYFVMVGQAVLESIWCTEHGIQ